MKRKLCAIALTICGLFMLSACGIAADPMNNANASDPVQREAIESEAAEFESAEGKQIRLTAGEVQVIVTLNDSRAAADLVQTLPLELTLIERNSFAKGMTLPARLSASEETTREYEIGDFGYWDAGPDLAIFYDDIYEQTVVPVIPLGRAESGAELLANTSGTIILELVKADSE